MVPAKHRANWDIRIYFKAPSMAAASQQAWGQKTALLKKKMGGFCYIRCRRKLSLSNRCAKKIRFSRQKTILSIQLYCEKEFYKSYRENHVVNSRSTEFMFQNNLIGLSMMLHCGVAKS